MALTLRCAQPPPSPPERTPPPDSADPEDVYERAALFDGYVDAINATDSSGANCHMSSMGICSLLTRRGYAMILQQSCRDRNRIAMQGDILGAAAMGVCCGQWRAKDHPLSATRGLTTAPAPWPATWVPTRAPWSTPSTSSPTASPHSIAAHCAPIAGASGVVTGARAIEVLEARSRAARRREKGSADKNGFLKELINNLEGLCELRESVVQSSLSVSKS